MHFTTTTTTTALALFGACAQAASVTFWSLDSTDRTIIFSPSPGSSGVGPITVSGGQQQNVPMPDNWQGNFYATQSGGSSSPGMLGELNYKGWGGQTCFDVSAIVNPHDDNNVKQMWPKSSNSPMSGCETFPCNNAYWAPDDVQTKCTQEDDIMVSLGTGSTGLSFS